MYYGACTSLLSVGDDIILHLQECEIPTKKLQRLISWPYFFGSFNLNKHNQAKDCLDCIHVGW